MANQQSLPPRPACVLRMERLPVGPDGVTASKEVSGQLVGGNFLLKGKDNISSNNEPYPQKLKSALIENVLCSTPSAVYVAELIVPSTITGVPALRVAANFASSPRT